MKIIQRLVLFSVLTSILASQIARGLYVFIPPTFMDSDIGFVWAIYLRESCYLFLFLASTIICLKKINTAYVPVVFLSLLLIYCLKDAVLLSDIQLLPFGVRIFILFGSVYSIVFFCTDGYSYNNIRVVFYLIKIILVIYGIVSVYQVFMFPATFGQTIFGARANGPYQNPINFSISIAAFCVAFYYSEEKDRKYWILLCLGLAFTTGGRAGILVTILVSVMTFIVGRLGRKFYMLAIISLPIIFQLISSGEISGRTETNDSGLKDGRLAQWSEIVNPIINSGVAPTLLGVALGQGTNASFRTQKNDSVIVSDSTFVMMFRCFGLIGFIFYVSILILPIIKYQLESVVIVGATFIFSMAQSFPEQHPAFLIMIFSFGLLARKKMLAPSL